jgi:hypothetical protein
VTSASSKAVPAQGAAPPGNVLLGGLALFAMIACLSTAYGFQYLADDARPLGYFLPFSLIYFLGLALVLAASLRGVPPLAGYGRRAAAIAGLASTTAALAMTLYFHSGELPFPALPAIAVLAIAVAAVAAVAGTGRALGLAVLLGLAVQTALALGNPLDVAAANMLPVIEAGCGKLLHGENPYLADYPGITSVPLLYLPGLLLPYCAPVAAGLDVRVLNVILLVAIVGYAAWALDFRKHPERLSLGLLPLLFSPAAGQMMVHGHVWLYWLLVLAFVHTLATRRFLVAALLLGLMLATRQMSLFLAIPAAAYMATRLAPLALLRYGAVSVGTYLVVMAPVMLTTPGWVDLFYLSIQKLGEQTHLTYGNPMNQVSLSGLLTDAGLAWLLRPLQAAVLLLVGAAFWVWRRRLTFDQVLVLLGVGYVLVIGSNAFLHRYFYFPGLILIALGIAYAAVGSLTAESGTRRPG